MLRPYLWIAALLATAAAYADAFTLLSAVGTIRYVGSIANTVSATTFACQPGDGGVTQTAQIQKSDGTVYLIDSYCEPKTYGFDVDPYAVTASHGAILQSTIATVQDHSRYKNSTLGGPTQPVSPTTARQLLQATITGCANRGTVDYDRNCATVGNFGYPNIGVSLKEDDGSAIPVSTLIAANCIGPVTVPVMFPDVVSFSDNTGTDYPDQHCRPSVTPDMIDAIQRNGENVPGSITEYGRSFRKNQAAQIALFTNFSMTQTEATDYLTSVGTAADTLDRELRDQDTSEDAIRAMLLEGLRNHTNSVDTDLSLSLNASLTLTRLAIDTADAFDRLMAESVNNTLEATARFSAITVEEADQTVVTFNALRYAQQSGISVFTILQREAEGIDVIEAQAEQVHRGLNNIGLTTASDGTPLHAFAEDIGRAPVENEMDLGDLSTLVTARDYFRYPTTMEGGTLFGVQTMIEWRCWSLAILDAGPMSPTWRDVTKLLGPYGCNATYTVDVPPQRRCRCFFVTTETRCRLGGALDAETWRIAVLDDDTTDTMCIDPMSAFVGGKNETIGRTFSDLAQTIADVSVRGVSPSSSYRMHSVMAPFAADIRYSSSASNASNFINLLQSFGSQDDGSTIVYFYAQSLPLSYQTAFDNLDYYRVRVKGEVPNYMDQEVGFFKRLLRGDAHRWTRFSIMLFSRNFLTVSTKTPTVIDTSIRVTVDGVDVEVTNVETTDPYEFILPRGTEAMVWDPDHPNDAIWNIRASSLPLSGYYPRREYTPLAAMVASPAQFTRDQLEAINGIRPVHRALSNTPDIYRIALDTDPSSLTYGRCVNEDDSLAVGDECLRRRRYTVVFTGPFNSTTVSGRMEYQSRFSTTTYTVILPVGPVTRDLISACPDVTQYAATGQQVLVRMSNPDTSDITFRIRQVGECARLFDDQVILSGGSIAPTFERCRFASQSTPDYIQISYLSTDVTPPAYLLCAQTIPLDFTPETAHAFQGAATVGHALDLAEVRASATLMYIKRMRERMIASMMEHATNSLEAETASGFQVTDSAIDSYASIVDSAQADTAAAAANAAASQNQAVDVTSIVAALRSKLDAESANFEQEIAELTAEFIRNVADNEAAESTLDDVRDFSRSDQSHLAGVVDSLSPLCESIDAALNGTIQRPQNPGIYVGRDLYPGITQFLHDGSQLGTDGVEAFNDAISPFEDLYNAFFGGGLSGFGFGTVLYAVLFAVAIIAAVYGLVYAFRRRNGPLLAPEKQAMQDALLNRLSKKRQ